MINYIKKTFTFWIEVYRDFKVWRVFRKTANEYKENLNKEISLYPESKIFIDRILNLIEK